MFFRKKEKTIEKPVYIPGTEIPYKPDLIRNLKNDHVELVALFTQVGACLERHDGKGLSENLAMFARKLRAHLLEENVCLYVYMKHVLKTEPDSLEIVISFQREMGEIGKMVNRFVTRYTASQEWSAQRYLEFGEEYRAVGRALTTRIGSEEESLYSLYLPPTAYRT